MTVHTQAYTGRCVIRPLVSALVKNADWSIPTWQNTLTSNPPSASSVYHPEHQAYKVRADIVYAVCAWASPSWVQFALGHPHSVVGILFGEKCDRIVQYVVSFTLIGSNDGSVWTTPGDAIYVNYNDNLNGTHWFDAPLPSRRLWRITVQEWNVSVPTARADLIGYITD